jgi:hypothetical protein
MGHPSLYVISSCVGNGRAIRPVAGLTIAQSAPVIFVTLRVSRRSGLQL